MSEPTLHLLGRYTNAPIKHIRFCLDCGSCFERGTAGCYRCPGCNQAYLAQARQKRLAQTSDCKTAIQAWTQNGRVFRSCWKPQHELVVRPKRFL